MVPDLVRHTLLSARNVSDADYISIYNGDGANIYDVQTTRIKISKAAVLKVLQCLLARLCCIPLKSNITNRKTYTLLSNIPDGQQYKNPIFSIPTSPMVVNHVKFLMDKHYKPPETIKTFYELPSIEPKIRYLHTAAGFMKKPRGSKPSDE